jgi:hypothetical protein
MHKGKMIGTYILIQSMCNFLCLIFIRNHVIFYSLLFVFLFSPFYILTFVKILPNHVCLVFFTPSCVLAFVIKIWLCLVFQVQVFICEVHVLLHFIFTFYPTLSKEALIDLNICERKILQNNIWPKHPLSLIHFSCRFSICLHPTMAIFKTFDKFQVFFFFLNYHIFKKFKL